MDSLPVKDNGDGLAVGAQEAADQFSFLQEYLPELVTYLQVGHKDFDPRLREAFAAYVTELHKSDFLPTIVEEVDAARVFFAEVFALELSQVAHKQVRRFRDAGTLDKTGALLLDKIATAVMRANETANKIKDQSGFARMARKDLNVGSRSALDEILQAVNGLNADGVQDMSPFLVVKVVAKRTTDPSQMDLAEATVVDDKITAAQISEMQEDDRE